LSRAPNLNSGKGKDMLKKFRISKILPNSEFELPRDVDREPIKFATFGIYLRN
jgi:hypothetical protein